MLRRLLSTFGRIDGVHATSIYDAEGAEVATFRLPSLHDAQLSSPSHATLREAGRLASESKIGEMNQVWLESPHGNIILAPLSGGHTLLVSSRGSNNIGRLRHEVRVRKPVIEDLLR